MSQLAAFFKGSDTRLGVFYPEHSLIAIFSNFERARSAKANLSRAGFSDDEALAVSGSDLVDLIHEESAKAGLFGYVMREFSRFHLWDEAEREKNPQHGMPQAIAEALRAAGRLKSTGPHAPATVRRRLALWSSLHRWRGLEGPFGSPSIRNALRLAIRAADRPRARKSVSAITRDVLDQLIATCRRGRAVDLRDRALLLLAFGSGGRRRSEIARLKVEDLEAREPVPADPSAPNDEKLPVLAIRLRRTKTATADAGESVLVVGRPVDALRAWLALSKIAAGPVFRRIDKWGNLGAGALDPQSVNAVIKSRCAVAGLDPGQFSAHGLRSGYLTEAARAGVPLPEAMQQSRHRSVQQAARYYNEGEITRGRAARLA